MKTGLPDGVEPAAADRRAAAHVRQVVDDEPGVVRGLGNIEQVEVGVRCEERAGGGDSAGEEDAVGQHGLVRPSADKQGAGGIVPGVPNLDRGRTVVAKRLHLRNGAESRDSGCQVHAIAVDDGSRQGSLAGDDPGRIAGEGVEFHQEGVISESVKVVAGRVDEPGGVADDAEEALGNGQFIHPQEPGRLGGVDVKCVDATIHTHGSGDRRDVNDAVVIRRGVAAGVAEGLPPDDVAGLVRVRRRLEVGGVDAIERARGTEGVVVGHERPAGCQVLGHHGGCIDDPLIQRGRPIDPTAHGVKAVEAAAGPEKDGAIGGIHHRREPEIEHRFVDDRLPEHLTRAGLEGDQLIVGIDGIRKVLCVHEYTILKDDRAGRSLEDDGSSRRTLARDPKDRGEIIGSIGRNGGVARAAGELRPVAEGNSLPICCDNQDCGCEKTRCFHGEYPSPTDARGRSV